MKLVCDFDGVLTDQLEEAQRVRVLFEDLLFNEVGLPQAWLKDELRSADHEIDTLPFAHGWFSSGRITAFANEDFFIRNNALGACLDKRAAASPSPQYKDALERLNKKDQASFSAAAQKAYERMVEETQRGALKPLDPSVPHVFETLLQKKNWEIVIVSNSSTERIVSLLEGAGLPLSKKLRVRGGARKFELGAKTDAFSIGPYLVDVARPSYEKILLEELPQAVIGDVFSLDLALPWALAKRDSSRFPKFQGFFRIQSYTPQWSRDFVKTERPLRPTLSFHEILELSDLTQF